MKMPVFIRKGYVTQYDRINVPLPIKATPSLLIFVSFLHWRTGGSDVVSR